MGVHVSGHMYVCVPMEIQGCHWVFSSVILLIYWDEFSQLNSSLCISGRLLSQLVLGICSLLFLIPGITVRSLFLGFQIPELLCSCLSKKGFFNPRAIFPAPAFSQIPQWDHIRLNCLLHPVSRVLLEFLQGASSELLTCFVTFCNWFSSWSYWSCKIRWSFCGRGYKGIKTETGDRRGLQRCLQRISGLCFVAKRETFQEEGVGWCTVVLTWQLSRNEMFTAEDRKKTYGFV